MGNSIGRDGEIMGGEKESSARGGGGGGGALTL